jgi:hypothetical protein
MKEFLASKKKKNWAGRPSLFTGLAPNDISLFPKIKEILKGRHLHDTDDIGSNSS